VFVHIFFVCGISYRYVRIYKQVRGDNSPELSTTFGVRSINHHGAQSMGIDGGVTLTKMLVRIPVEPSPEVLKFSVNCLSCCYKFVSKTQQKYIKLTENHRKTSKLQERARPVSFATSHPHLFPCPEAHNRMLHASGLVSRYPEKILSTQIIAIHNLFTTDL